MDIEPENKNPPGREGSGPFDPSYLELDIKSLIATMKQSKIWTEGNLNSMVLLRNSEKQVLLNALHEDTEVSSYNASDTVIIDVIEGRMQVQTIEKTVILEKDQMVSLHGKVKYSLTTLEPTVFLLTLVSRSYPGLEN